MDNNLPYAHIIQNTFNFCKKNINLWHQKSIKFTRALYAFRRIINIEKNCKFENHVNSEKRCVHLWAMR